MAKPTPQKKLELLVWNWKMASEKERKQIVQAAYLIARGEGIAFLSWHLHIPQKKLRQIGDIPQFHKKANRWRRGRGPNPRHLWLEREYGQLAAVAASWCGEDRRGRRNASSNTTRRRAARG
ncbi:MAG: hypothetical protein AB1776_08625 [Bacillota bacterium]